MKKSWVIAIGLFAGLAALFALGRIWRDDASPSDGRGRRDMLAGVTDRDGGGAHGGAGNWNSGANGRGSKSDPRSGDTRPGGGRPSNNNSGNGWPRLPSRADAPVDDADSAAARSQVEGGGRNAPLTHPAVPPASAQGPHDAATDDGDPANEEEQEPVPAYDAGERVFDTRTQTEVTDASMANANAGSITFWIEPQWGEGNGDGASFVRFGDGGIRLVKDGTELHFEYVDGNGNTVQGGAADISGWNAGDWRHVAAIWRDGSFSLYIDGGQLFMNHPGGSPPSSPVGATVYFGGTASGGMIAPAQISNIQLWNTDLAAQTVRQLFESGGQRTP